MIKKIIISITILIFCVLSNFAPLSYVFQTFTNDGYYRYCNYNGSNIMVEGVHKSYGLDLMKRHHQSWLNQNPQTPDKKLYRIFWKNPFTFWRWRSYFVDERYKLPYKDWDEIKALRKKQISH